MMVFGTLTEEGAGQHSKSGLFNLLSLQAGSEGRACHSFKAARESLTRSIDFSQKGIKLLTDAMTAPVPSK